MKHDLLSCGLIPQWYCEQLFHEVAILTDGCGLIPQWYCEQQVSLEVLGLEGCGLIPQWYCEQRNTYTINTTRFAVD